MKILGNVPRKVFVGNDVVRRARLNDEQVYTSPDFYAGAWALRSPWATIDGQVFDQRDNIGTPRPPQPRRAKQFNGTNQYGWYPLRDPIAAYPFTLFGRFRSSDLNTARTIFAVSDASLNSVSIGLNSSGVLRLIRNSTEVAALSGNGGFPNDQWVSLVFSFNSDTEVVVYRDGQLLFTATFASSNLPGVLTHFVLASRRHTSPTAYWTAHAQHCGYLRRAATLEDAQTFHNTGIIPNAEGLFLLDENSTTVAYNIGTEGETFARRNRLSWSKEYTNAAWGPVTAGAGVNPVCTANVAIAPNGTMTADQIDFNRGGTGASDQSELVQVFSSAFAAGQNATAAIWMKAATPADVGKQVSWRHVGATTYGVITLTADWVRYTRTEIAGASANNIRFGSRQGFSADVAVSVHVWNSQIEEGTSATDDQIITTGIYTNEMTLVNGSAGMLYEGRDVPFSRQNEVGYSERRNLLVNTHFTGSVAGSPGTVPTSWTNSFTTGEIVSYDAVTGKLRLRTSGTRRVFNQAANMPTNSVQISRLRVNVISGTIAVNRVLGINVALAPGASVQYQINGVNAAATDSLPLGESLITYQQTTTTDAWTLNLLVGNGTGDVTTADVEIWEPQLELGSTATPYQRIGANPGTNVLFPATLHTPGESAAGDPLTFTGEAPFNGQLQESNCFTFDGSDDRVAMDLADIAGPESVTNGDFSNGTTGWTDNFETTIAGGTLTLNAVVAARRRQDNVTVTGRRYYFEIVVNSSSSSWRIDNGEAVFTNYGTFGVVNGTVRGTFTAVGDKVRFLNNNGSGVIVVDSITVRELPTISASPIIRPNLVTNSDFASDTVWTRGTGWTIGSGVATATSVASGVALTQPLPLIGTLTYRVTYTVVTATSGGVRIALTGAGSGPANGIVRTTPGTYTQDLVANPGNNTVSILADTAGFSGTIDNVTVQPLQIISSKGTSHVYYHPQGLGITGTAGTAYDIRLGDAEEIPCSEGEDDKVYGVIRNVAYPIINGQVSNWDTKQNQFHYNMVHGHSQEPFDPVAEINALLFGAGQQGLFIAPTWTPSLITGSSFGTGVQTLTDLSPRNNPASQATPASRGAWFREPKRGRVNILLQTVALTTSPWFTSGGEATQGTGIAPIITPGQLAPDGTSTAWRLQLNCGGGTTFNDRSGVSQLVSGLPLSITSTQVWVKPLDGTTGAQLAALGNFSILAVGGNPQVNNAATAQSDGWFLLTRNVTPAVTNGSYRFQLIGTQQQTLDVLVWNPQAEVGATPTAPQRVTTAFDVTEQGQRDCYGVWADGVDDWYTTGSIDFSGTAQVTVFAAVRKLSDAATGILCELSATNVSNNGAFALVVPSLNGANSYRFQSKFDTVTRDAGTGVFAPAPDTCVLTGIGDISAPLSRLRRNGTVIESNTTSQGVGNYGNYPLFLFRREGTTFPFNGRLYALIVAGGSYSLSTIQRVERLLSRITPTVNL